MKANISIECGETVPEDGFIKVWRWFSTGQLNKEYKSNRPVWEIFDAHATFLLCVVGATIEVDEELLINNFTEV